MATKKKVKKVAAKKAPRKPAKKAVQKPAKKAKSAVPAGASTPAPPSPLALYPSPARGRGQGEGKGEGGGSTGKADKPGEAPLDAEHQVPGGVLLGRVEDYFAHVGVVALTLQAPLSVGDMIRVKGHTTDITQKIESIQIDHRPVQTASPKDAVGIRVADRSRKGDAVYKI